MNPIRPRSDVEGARLTEIEQYGSGIVEKGEHAPWAALGDHVEIGHAAPELRVSGAEVVSNVQTRHHRGVSSARLVHLQQIGHGHAVLTPMLLVISMITGDFLSMLATTDNVTISRAPNVWNVGHLTMAGIVLGLCDLIFCTGVLAVGKYRLDFGIETLHVCISREEATHRSPVI